MTRGEAQAIAKRVNREWGETVCTADDVLAIFRGESLRDRESVESRILQALSEMGYTDG